MSRVDVWKMPLRVVLWYLGLGAVYILCSDMVLGFLVQDHDSLMRLGIMKGWIFLLVTGALLFLLIRRGMALLVSKHELLSRSEAHYRMLFDKMQSGFAVHEIICDDAGTPVDYRFLEFNPSFEQITGLKAADVIGKTCREVLPGVEDLWLEMYGTVALSGEPAQFGGYSRDLGRYYEVSAYCPAPGTFAVICSDVTPQREAEEELRRLYGELERRVDERTAQLTEANESLRQEISQRMHAEEEICWLNDDLMRQKSELEAANRELEAFSFSVSHDLRAPLRHINGLAQALQGHLDGKLDETAQEYLRRVVKSCDTTERLIDELLELSRIGRGTVQRKTLDLSALARDIADALLEGDPQRAVAFTVAEGLSAHGDETLMRVVLGNLLGNAYKYTGKTPRAEIEFGSREGESGAIFFVRDNGAGFDMRYAQRLFGAFQRLHRREEFEGTGVGLAIVQRIVNRHHGSVWAQAEPGKGATFFFTLGWVPQERMGQDALPASSGNVEAVGGAGSGGFTGVSEG